MSRPHKVRWDYGTLADLTGRLWRYGDRFEGRAWAMALHSFTADGTQWLPGGGAYTPHSIGLAEAGVVVLAPLAGGVDGWNGPAAHAALDALYLYAVETLGLADRCGILGRSMGSTLGLDWSRHNPDLVRAVLVYAPCTDLDAAHADPLFTAALDTAFGGNYAANSVDHKIIAEAAGYRGLPFPIHINHGDADTTFDVSQSEAFVAAVDDPGVTLSVVAGGDHNLGNNVSASETVARLAA